MQIEETVWITASEICVILHIIRKLDSIIVLLFIPNISKFFTSLPLCRLSPKQVSLFLDTVPRYRVFSPRGAASGDIFARHLATHQRIWN